MDWTRGCVTRKMVEDWQWDNGMYYLLEVPNVTHRQCHRLPYRPLPTSPITLLITHRLLHYQLLASLPTACLIHHRPRHHPPHCPSHGHLEMVCVCVYVEGGGEEILLWFHFWNKISHPERTSLRKVARNNLIRVTNISFLLENFLSQVNRFA